MVGELEQAGCSRHFGGGAEVRPGVGGRGGVGAGEHSEARAASALIKPTENESSPNLPFKQDSPARISAGDRVTH